jgi:RimJ/RimL family protein N-acetyltransferase
VSRRVVGSLIYGEDQRVSDWISISQGGEPVKIPTLAIGAENEDGELTMGVSFSNLRDLPSGRDIEVALHSTSPRYAQPHILRQVLRFVFDTLECTRVTAEIPTENQDCLRFAQGIGFEFEGLKRGTCVIILGLTREDWQKPRKKRIKQ